MAVVMLMNKMTNMMVRLIIVTRTSLMVMFAYIGPCGSLSPKS